MRGSLFLAALVLGLGCASFEEAQSAWCSRHLAECDAGTIGGGEGGGGGTTGGGGATGGGGGGGGGSIGRVRDGGWQLQSISTTEQLRAVWGSEPNDVWVVGMGGTILHYDGVRWAAEDGGGPTDLYKGVWGRREGDGGVVVWAVGDKVRRRTGGRWSLQSSTGCGYLAGVWGAADGPVWAVGENGVICVSDGGTDWSRVDSGVSTHLRAVWGSAADDVWAVGEETTRWDGTSWSRVDAGPGLSFLGLSGTGPGEVWGAANSSLYHYDAGWNFVASFFHDPLAVWASAPDDVWVTGLTGRIFHWNGSTLDTTIWPDADGGPDLYGIWGGAPGDFWVVGSGGVILGSP